MKTQFHNLAIAAKTFLALSVLAAGTGSYGDDTEVFYSSNVSKPNLLFVLDISGSMRTRVPNSGSSTNNTVSHTVDRMVVNRNDDAEQASSGGSMSLRDSYLDLGYEYYDFQAPQRTGLRFYNIGVPKGAEITNAYIQFEVRENDQYSTSPIALRIVGEAADNAKRFSKKNSGKISTRTVTAEAVDWEPPVWQSVGDRGEDQRTSDLSSIVQTIVDRDNWDKDNGMVFIIEGKPGNTGNRIAKSYDRRASDAPSLHIEYDTVEPGVDKKRIEVMQESLRRVLEKAPDNVNVGLMNYGQQGLVTSNPQNYRHNSVSGVAFPVTDINAKAREIIPTAGDVYGLPHFPDENTTVREYIADVADSWSENSYTPIVDALYEAALYYRGEKMHYGQNLPTLNGAHPSTYDGSIVTTNVTNTSGPGRVYANAPKYKSPIASSCQSNYIVLMTDGAPTYRRSGSSSQSFQGPFASIRNQTNGPQGTLATALAAPCSAPVGVSAAGTCGSEITHYLATHDNLPSPTSSFPSGQEGDQIIETFTIGFGTANSDGSESGTERYLKSLATYDDGNSGTSDDGYYRADSAEQLATAFKNILDAVAEPSGTLASPGYSVNVKNGLENEKDIYIPVFDRKNSSRWTGNLKKFRIVDEGGSRLIRGKNNLNVTNDLGHFTTDALDYWSTSPASAPDGRAVEKGGLASLLTNPAARNIYSNLSGNTNVTLTAAENHLDATNMSNIDNDVLALPDSADLALRTKIVNFMRGWKEGDGTSSAKEARLHMGDMLHSEPVVITYNKGVVPADKQQYVFAATNEGYLHAFDAQTGEEKFAFIPKELLKIAEPQMRNEGTQVDHKYGIDGTITYQFNGSKDGIVNTGDQIILYFGLRRGGSSYYALDVTNIDQPKLLWTKSVADYSSMGQSWSIPYLNRVGKVGSTCVNGQTDCKEVVVISGGYDEDEDRDLPDGSGKVDDATSTVTADVGNDILILDAMDGSLIWSMPGSMRSRITSSIPGGVRVLDTNQDKLLDRMYFADTGGHVWRLDLSGKFGDSSAAAPVLTEFADLGSTGRGQDNRMFFNEPDVASLKLGGRTVFAISIGSGFRPHPMDESIDDKFFVLVDKSPYKPLETSGSNAFSAIKVSDLAAINISTSSISQTGSIQDADKKGWVVNFSENGEKVLSTALSFEGKITFSTLVPEAQSTGIGIDQCSAPVTQSRTYILNVLSGQSAIPEIYIPGPPGIANIPQRFFNPPVFSEDGEDNSDINGNSLDADGNVAKACSHPVDLRQGTKLTEITGYDACKLESVYWSDPAAAK